LASESPKGIGTPKTWTIPLLPIEELDILEGSNPRKHLLFADTDCSSPRADPIDLNEDPHGHTPTNVLVDVMGDNWEIPHRHATMVVNGSHTPPAMSASQALKNN
jgi:hypothetical protein